MDNRRFFCLLFRSAWVKINGGEFALAVNGTHHLNNWLILTNEHFRSMENQYLCR